MSCSGVLFAQGTLTPHTFMVTKRPIGDGVDSSGSQKFKTDSVIVTVITSYDHLVNQLSEVYIQFGDTINTSNGMNETIYFTTPYNITSYTGMGFENQQLSYGKNFVIDFKYKVNPHLKWATLYYKNSQGIVSEKKYCKIGN